MEEEGLGRDGGNAANPAELDMNRGEDQRKSGETGRSHKAVPNPSIHGAAHVKLI